MLLKPVLDAWCPGTELEARYYIDPRAPRPAGFAPARHAAIASTLRAIVAHMQSCTTTRIVDVRAGTCRKRIEFVAAAVAAGTVVGGTVGTALPVHTRREIWTEKTPIVHADEANDFGGLRLALSAERACAPRHLVHADSVAVKYRYSAPVAHAWRLDVSAVRRVDITTAAAARDRMLACTDAFAEWDWWQHWEVELEWTGAEPAGSTARPWCTADWLYAQYTHLAPAHPVPLLLRTREIAQRVKAPAIATWSRIAPSATITRLLPRARELTREAWRDAHTSHVVGMILRDKIDGRRELVVVGEGRIEALGASSWEAWSAATEAEREACTADHVLDCEWCERTECWYVLHALRWHGRDVTALCDSARLALLAQLPSITGLAVCAWQRVVDPARDIPAWCARTTEYRRDGILLAYDEAYWTQRCYKWKPAGESTIDMLVVRVPDWLEGQDPYLPRSGLTTYILCVGAAAGAAVPAGIAASRWREQWHLARDAYAPVPFAPPGAIEAHVWRTARSDLHGAIAEFLPSGAAESAAAWQLVRLRADKPSLLRGGTEQGNDIRTALDVWHKRSEPFEMQALWASAAEVPAASAALAAALAAAVDTLATEESITTVATHHCAWLNVAAARRVVLRPEGTTDSDSSHAVPDGARAVEYRTLARVPWPAGMPVGPQLLVSCDPRALASAAALARAVAPGGRLLVATDPALNDHEAVVAAMSRVQCVYVEQHLAPAGWCIASYRRACHGTLSMTTEEVHRENPHLAACATANYTYRFTRQKTKDVSSACTRADRLCCTLVRDTLRGELLVDAEFLSTLTGERHVTCVGLHAAARAAALATLFTEMHFASASDAAEAAPAFDVAVVHGTHAEAQHIARTRTPHHMMFDVDAEAMREPIMRGRLMLYPYAEPGTTRVAVHAAAGYRTWSIASDVFTAEMHTFHHVYRASAFRYAARHAALDNCYDCRSEVYIIARVAKAQKNTFEAARSRFDAALTQFRAAART